MARLEWNIVFGILSGMSDSICPVKIPLFLGSVIALPCTGYLLTLTLSVKQEGHLGGNEAWWEQFGPEWMRVSMLCVIFPVAESQGKKWIIRIIVSSSGKQISVKDILLHSSHLCFHKSICPGYLHSLTEMGESAYWFALQTVAENFSEFQRFYKHWNSWYIFNWHILKLC